MEKHKLKFTMSPKTFFDYKHALNGYVFWQIHGDHMVEVVQVQPEKIVTEILKLITLKK